MLVAQIFAGSVASWAARVWAKQIEVITRQIIPAAVNCTGSTSAPERYLIVW